LTIAAMVEPAGMCPGAGRGPAGRRLDTHAGLASTGVPPTVATSPVATPDGDGTTPAVVTPDGGETVPHATVMSKSKQGKTPLTTAPRMMHRAFPLRQPGLPECRTPLPGHLKLVVILCD